MISSKKLMGRSRESSRVVREKRYSKVISLWRCNTRSTLIFIHRRDSLDLFETSNATLQFVCFMFQQKCVKARALYDNIAEAPDELAFRKGDVLTVLEQNTAGLEGWWLCALRGRQVITSFNQLLLFSLSLSFFF